jgi:hypothetical protein
MHRFGGFPCQGPVVRIHREAVTGIVSLPLSTNAPGPGLVIVSTAKQANSGEMWAAVLFVTLGVGCASLHAQQSNNEAFEQHFRLTGTVRLDSAAMVGEVWSLAVSSRGDLLVADRMTHAVYLFAPNGTLRTKLGAEPCHPGFVWDPLVVMFNYSDEIYVVNNSSPRAYRFRKDGTCSGPLDLSFIPTPYMCFDRSGNLYGYYAIVQQEPLRKMDARGKLIHAWGEFPRGFIGVIDRVEGGGIACDDDGNIYWAVVTHPTIWKYNRSFHLVMEISDPPAYYRQVAPAPSLIGGGSANIMKEIGQRVKDRNLTVSLHLLAKNKLLIQYETRHGYGLQVFSVKGENLMKEDLRVGSPVRFARDNRIYIVEQPAPDKNGYLPNPEIKIYTLLL